jgi:PBP1b-binding outer membrane lipoprotein LpoB
MRYIILVLLLASCTHNAANQRVVAQQYNLHWPLTIQDIDHIRTTIQNQFTMIAGTEKMDEIIGMEVHLKKDGAILDVINKDQDRYQSDANYRTLSDSAKRAIYKANPFENKGLPTVLPPYSCTSL